MVSRLADRSKSRDKHGCDNSNILGTFVSIKLEKYGPQIFS